MKLKITPENDIHYLWFDYIGPEYRNKNNLYHLGSLKKLCCTSIEWSYSKDNYLNDNLYHFWYKVSKNVLIDIKRISGNPNRLRRILKTSPRQQYL